MREEHNETGVLTREEKNRLFMTLDAQTEKLSKIERGVYGDKANHVKGALERLEGIEEWMGKVKLKTAYISGAVAIVAFLAMRFWEWLVNSKKL